MAAQAPVSAALGAGEAAYGVSGLRAVSRMQRLGLVFTRAGVQISSGRLRLGLGLVAYGHGRALRPVGVTVPLSHKNRVLYRLGGVREWFANGPLGLEQGFDVSRRPAGHGRLVLSIAVAGDLRMRTADGAVLFSGAGVSLRYAGLVATDARGRKLPASLTLTGGRLVISVDDRDASYPLHIDPIVQQAELSASDGVANGLLGISVAVSGSTIAAGAPSHAVGGNASQGVVYVFTQTDGVWSQTAELTASDGAVNDQLGQSVAVSGSTIAAGALNHVVGGNGAQGAVYVWTEPMTGWANATQTAELTASDGATDAFLGRSVAVSGSTIAADRGGSGGAVYVWTEPTNGWANATQTAELTVSNGRVDYGLGVSGSTIAAGAADQTVGGNAYQGAVYVWTEPTNGWANATQTGELTASDGAAGDYLGYAVAVSGSTIAAGDGGHTVGGNESQGAVYVWTEPTNGWANATQTAELTASNGAANDYLGGAVAVSGSTIAASAADQTVGSNAYQGAVYVWTEPTNGWANATQTTELTASDGAANDYLGGAVAVSGSTIAASAPHHTVGSNANQGAVYVFIAPPASTLPPAISGSATAGQVLTEAHGSWSDTPTGYAYQWEACDSSGNSCSAIAGATGQTYQLIAGDVGDTIRVQETASNAAGSSGPASSAATGVVQAASTGGGGSSPSGGTTTTPSSLGRGGAKAAATSGSAVSEILVCAGTSSQTCTFTETLTVLETLHGSTLVAVSASAGRPANTKKKTVTVGSKRVTLSGGQSERVKLTLNSTGAALLKKRGSLPLTFTVKQGHQTLHSEKVTFKKPKKK